MDDIQFYMPKDLTIPTNLALTVGDTMVWYGKFKDGFIFDVYESNQDKAEEVVNRIIERLLSEHPDWTSVTYALTKPGEKTNTFEWVYDPYGKRNRE